MEFENYDDNCEYSNLEYAFKWYKIETADPDVLYTPAFTSEEAAIKYAIKLGGEVSTLKEVNVFDTGDGYYVKQESLLHFVPNLKYPSFTYRFIGEDVDNEYPDFVAFFTGGEDKYDQLEEFTKAVDRYYDGRSYVALYELTVTVNEDKETVSKDIKVIYEIKKEKTK